MNKYKKLKKNKNLKKTNQKIIRNISKSIGDWLRANPKLEYMGRSEIIVGNSLAYSDNKLQAKRLTTSKAMDLLLLETHLKGVNFFTERNSKTSILNLGIFGKDYFMVSVSEYGRGHIGNFKIINKE